MKFIFWQNVISIHQSAFIKALSKEHQVTLVAAEDLTEQRRADGWSIPEMGNARIVMNPDETEINVLLESGGDIQQIFSGIDAFPMVYKAFKMAIDKGCEVSVMMEPYQWQGLKGFLRRCKYALHALRYGKHIKHIFATGDLGVRAFRKAGFPEQKLHQWGYFTEQTEITTPRQNAKPKMIFVGSIDQRKNILALVDAANHCSNQYDEFLIIGGGPLEHELKQAISSNHQIHYLGRVRNESIGSLIASCDLLVLPSLFDGWGAVVNEALTQGTRVLCSDNCGASVLLDGKERGGVFKLSEQNSLQNQLKNWLMKGVLCPEERQRIALWASETISGSKAADYFMRCYDCQCPDIPMGYPPQVRPELPSLIFVGRLDDNKNLLSILQRYDDLKHLIGQFTIVGDGVFRSRFEKITSQYNNIVMVGVLDNITTKTLMSAHDYLVLPSKYDGWGAVVNEALSSGIRVICSDSCGAEVLLDGKMRGEAFAQGDLVKGLCKWLGTGPLRESSRQEIRQWAYEHISGSTASRYFTSFFATSYNQKLWYK